MDTGNDDIANLVRNLNIADDATRDGPDSRGSMHNDTACLQDAVHALIRSTKTTTSLARSVRSFTADATFSQDQPMTKLSSLCDGIEKLTDVASDLRDIVAALNDAVERSIIAHLRSYESRSTSIIHKLISHFHGEIRGIVGEVLRHANSEDWVWQIAERCYHQATSPSGKLDADDYFIPLEEACLEWPYDPNFKSEEYYEHENRLHVDKGYAAAIQYRADLRAKTRREERQSWPEFWARVLSNSPGGPTLFCPPPSLATKFANNDTVPPYLFRTFDTKSSGRNDGSVIASIASVLGSHESSRIDILTLPQARATDLLHEHLTKKCFSGDESDNLMSWTSSLLFAIQYAIWRSEIGQSSTANVKICVVDTRKFPRGQFVQDICLLKAYHETARHMGDPARDFFNFRLGRDEYYNGEYLSQGAVHLKDRSCTVSLNELIQAGLFQLYPDFAAAGSGRQWTNRVRELRQNWSIEQRTTDQEIRHALCVARTCFPQLDTNDMASLLLSFKCRTLTKGRPHSYGLFRNDAHANQNEPNDLGFLRKPRPTWADKPDEVCRYWIAAEAVKPSDEGRGLTMGFLLDGCYRVLREMYE